MSGMAHIAKVERGGREISLVGNPTSKIQSGECERSQIEGLANPDFDISVGLSPRGDRFLLDSLLFACGSKNPHPSADTVCALLPIR
jgi:hypothetical protein